MKKTLASILLEESSEAEDANWLLSASPARPVKDDNETAVHFNRWIYFFYMRQR